MVWSENSARILHLLVHANGTFARTAPPPQKDASFQAILWKISPSHRFAYLRCASLFSSLTRPSSTSSFFSSEEDNDPLTDDGGSAISIPVSLRSSRAQNAPHTSKLSSRARHQLASSMLSDDGTDSQTYDGDVESSIIAGTGQHQASKGFLYPNLRHASSNSTLTSQIEDHTYSPFTSQHLTPPTAAQSVVLPEPPMNNACNPASFTPEDIQAFVQRAIDGEPGRPYSINPPPIGRPVRIFADGETDHNPVLRPVLRYTSGVYDLFHFGYE